MRSGSRSRSPVRFEETKSKKIYISGLPEDVNIHFKLRSTIRMSRSYLKNLARLLMFMSRTRKDSALPLSSTIASTRLKKLSERKTFTFDFLIWKNIIQHESTRIQRKGNESQLFKAKSSKK